MGSMFLTIEGIRVSVLRYGDTGIPILILHGWGSSAKTWHNTAVQLSNKGYRVIIPDLPGFGSSGEPPATWGLTEYVTFVCMLITHLHLSDIVLVGHSFGGRIAIEYAASDNPLPRGLVLCSAAGISRNKSIKVRIASRMSTFGAYVFTLPVLERLYTFFRRVLYRVLRSNDYYNASSVMRSVMRKVIEKPLQQYLPRIAMPVLLLWGDKDSFTPIADAHRAHTLLPNSTLVVCEGKGHSLQRECPHLVAEHIISFVNDNFD